MDNILAENLLLICSICLDPILNYEERSCAKLKCGHEFHLDCIGSAFNKKGAMKCPNCRNIEDGTWLYGNGSTSSSFDFSLDDWESYLGLLDSIPSYDESTSSVMTEEQLLFQNMSSYRALNPSTLRSTRADPDTMSRSGPSAIPFHYSDTSFTRSRSSFVSSLNHPGSSTRPHERIQVLDVGNSTSLISPIMPGARRLGGPMGMPVSTPAPPQGGFSFFSTPAPPQGDFSFFSQNLHLDNRNRLSRFPAMSFERESGWESQRQAYGGSDASHRSGNFWRS